jgi:hypothetical protein
VELPAPWLPGWLSETSTGKLIAVIVHCSGVAKVALGTKTNVAGRSFQTYTVTSAFGACPFNTSDCASAKMPERQINASPSQDLFANPLIVAHK